MPLLLLRSTPNVHIYYDRSNDWLFIDWQGKVDLCAARLAGLELAQVCQQRFYRRALNSNAQVTETSWDISAWLTQEFLPYLQLAGIEQLAWVSGRTPRGHDIAHDLLNRLSPVPITFFDDLDMAVDWLQRYRPYVAASHATKAARPRPLRAA